MPPSNTGGSSSRGNRVPIDDADIYMTVPPGSRRAAVRVEDETIFLTLHDVRRLIESFQSLHNEMIDRGCR